MQNNYAKVYGVLEEDFEYSHTTDQGEDFFRSRLSVKRYSKAIDYVPIIVSGDLITHEMVKGTFVQVKGSLRSHSQLGVDGKSHLHIYVFAESIYRSYTREYINYINVSAAIRRIEPLRITPLGRIITDFTIDVPKYHKRTCVIPCITWGQNAEYIQEKWIGNRMELVGRFQSREYIDQNGKPHEVYEISVSKIRDLG